MAFRIPQRTLQDSNFKRFVQSQSDQILSGGKRWLLKWPKLHLQHSLCLTSSKHFSCCNAVSFWPQTSDASLLHLHLSWSLLPCPRHWSVPMIHCSLVCGRCPSCLIWHRTKPPLYLSLKEHHLCLAGETLLLRWCCTRATIPHDK